MSSIPNSAMPHAGEIIDQNEQAQASESSESTTAFTQIADKAREYPKTAIAAGAAVAAGVVAAATLTARSRSRSGGNTKGNKSSKND
ncbi:MAG: hypothetical protein ACXW2T_00450 [Allosphingosinicella sp.]